MRPKQVVRHGFMPIMILMGAVALGLVIAVMSAARSHAATIDDSKGYPVACIAGRVWFENCPSWVPMYLGIRIEGEQDMETGGSERAAVINIEVFDEYGNQLYFGAPRSVSLARARYGQSAMTTVTIPSFVSGFYAEEGVETWFQVWIYVSGPRFETDDSREIWVGYNLPPPPPPCVDCKG